MMRKDIFGAQIFSDFLQNLEIRAPNIPNNVDVSLRSFIGLFCCFVKKKQDTKMSLYHLLQRLKGVFIYMYV